MFSLVLIGATLIGVVLFLLRKWFTKNATAGFPEPSPPSEEPTKETSEHSRKEGPKKAKKGKKSDHHHDPLFLRLFKGHLDDITHVSPTTGGATLGTCSKDRTVRLWAMDTITEDSPTYARVNLPQDFASCCAFGEFGRFLLVGLGDSRKLCMFKLPKAAKDVPPSQRPRPKMVHEYDSGHVGNIVGVGLSVSQKLMVSGSDDGVLKLWHTNGAEIAVVKTNQGYLNGTVLSPDGRFVACFGFTSDITLYEVKTTKGSGVVEGAARAMTLAGHRSGVTSVDFSTDCSHMVTASSDGTIRIWNIVVRYWLSEDPKCEHVFAAEDYGLAPFERVAFSADGSLLAASTGSTLFFLDAHTGTLTKQIDTAHQGVITTLRWCPYPQVEVGENGRAVCHGPGVLVSGGVDHHVNVWKAPQDSDESLLNHRLIM